MIQVIIVGHISTLKYLEPMLNHTYKEVRINLRLLCSNFDSNGDGWPKIDDYGKTV